MKFYKSYYENEISNLILVSNESAIVGLFWETSSRRFPKHLTEAIEGKNKLLDQLSDQLDIYFSGNLKEFELPLEFIGTPFQKQVWQELMKIPFGKTITYRDIGVAMNSKAYQAIGNSVGWNPLSIVAPCHRVIGSNGKLTGYAGGLDVKEKLLKLENSL